MGLSERKVKQKIGLDPRNLSWSADNDRFSVKHMTSLGWKASSGLGSSLDGNPNHIAVARKLDNSGIGMGRARKEGDDRAAGAGEAGRGLEDVLRRLQGSASASPVPVTATTTTTVASIEDGNDEVVVEVKTVIRNKVASRQKHLHSKRLASSSPAALAEILGVPLSSLPSPSTSGPSTPLPGDSTPASSTPSGSSTPVPSADERTAEETVSTSTQSVSDYFRQKLREKMQARQSASGSATPQLREGSLAALKEEVKVNVGGVAWEGSKVTFGGVQPGSPSTVDSEDDASTIAPVIVSSAVTSSAPTPTVSAEIDSEKLSKAEKRQRKEEKRLRKEEKRKRKEEKQAKKDAKAAVAVASVTPPTPSGVDVESAADSKKRKRDKGEKKDKEGKKKTKAT